MRKTGLLSRIYRRGKRELKRGHLVAGVRSKESWESQYESGFWDRLRRVEQLAQYSIIVGCFQYFKPGGSVLDIGCGEGVLQERLSSAYSRYVGIDVSAEAIRRASHKEDAKTSFIVADVEEYTPAGSFDVIIFNETLYYFEDPSGVVKRYENWLEKDGIFIISMVHRRRYKAIWKRLEATYSLVDETKLINTRGPRFCKVLTIPSRPNRS